MFDSPYFRNRMARFTRRHPTAVANRSDATPRPDASVASVRDFTEQSRRTLENTKKLEEERKEKRESRRERAKDLNKTMFYLDLNLAEDKHELIKLFTDTAKKQLEGDIKLDKEKVKKEVLNKKNLLEKKKEIQGILGKTQQEFWNKEVAVAYGKLLTAIDPMTSRIARLASGAPEGGRRKTKRRKTRKRKKIKRRKKTRKKMKTRKKTKRRRKRIKKKN